MKLLKIPLIEFLSGWLQIITKLLDVFRSTETSEGGRLGAEKTKCK